jgi:hypothetical protein
MTDPIRIPVLDGACGDSIIEITPALARQIVALAGMDHRIDAIYDSLADRIRGGLDLAKRVEAMEQKLSALDNEITGDIDRRVLLLERNLHQHAHNVSGDSTDGIYNLEPFLGEAHQSELEQAHKPVDAGPATPPADDAAARVIASSIRAALYRHASGDYDSSANALAADIVARRLIGVWAYPERENPAVTISALRAQLAEAKADAERAKAERNKNEAQFVEMQRAGDIRHLRKLTQEANEARAQLAEYEANAQLRDREESACRAALKQAGLNAMLVESVPLSDGIRRLANDLAEAKAKLDYANRERDSLTRERNNFKDSNDTAIRQRDEARAEVAALKGRKVTLPTNGILRQCGATFYLEELVIKAIRTAGVEVA